MRWIRRSTELAVAALVVASAGCSSELPAPFAAAHGDGGTPARGGILQLASFADIRTIDPANVADGLVVQINQAIFAGLIDYDADGQIRPDIAERWESADGGKTLRFFLRPGVRFHDGDEVTADDVKRSVERALHPSAPNPGSAFFASIAGYDGYARPKAGVEPTEHLAGVEVEGRYVVTFRLTEPDATFLPTLALHVLRPVCKSAGNRYSDTWHPCGAGPFKLLPGAWERGRHIQLVRHDGYYRPGLPRLDGVRWTFQVNFVSQRYKFTSGDIDVMRDFLAPDLLKFQADPRWKPFGEFETEKQIGGDAMNTEMAPFDNVEVRRAVSAAIDRDEIRLIRAANLRAANQPVPPSVFGHDDALVGQRYDYAAALEHMRRAGYAYDPVAKTGGYPHVVVYDVYKQGLNEFSAQVVAQQLAKIGIRLEIRVVNYPTLMAIRGRRHRSAFGPGMWMQDYPEASSFLEPLFHSRSINDDDSNNWSFYNNPRVDELIDRAKHELDAPERKKLYVETQRILCDEAPWAFTYYYRWYVQRQPYVREYRSHPTWTHDLSSTWLDRAAGPLASRALFGPHALAALTGGR